MILATTAVRVEFPEAPWLGGPFRLRVHFFFTCDVFSMCYMDDPRGRVFIFPMKWRAKVLRFRVSQPHDRL